MDILGVFFRSEWFTETHLFILEKGTSSHRMCVFTKAFYMSLSKFNKNEMTNYSFDIRHALFPSCIASDYTPVWIPHSPPNPVPSLLPQSSHHPAPAVLRLSHPMSSALRRRHLQFPRAQLPHAPSLLLILMKWWRVWNPHWPPQKARAAV